MSKAALFTLGWVVYSAIYVSNVQAHSVYPCTPDAPADTECSVGLEQVHPSQFSVGMREVNSKRDEMSRMDSSQLQKYLKKHVLPCVVGPDGRFYATDAHHDSLAALLAGQQDYPAKVLANMRSLDWTAFWSRMESQNWVYLYDENGLGPLDPSRLPEHLEGMKDDVYRGLAWGVREQNGYEKTDASFADFIWADFFRARIPIDLVQKHFDDAVSEGVILARSPEAANLPGYEGNR